MKPVYLRKGTNPYSAISGTALEAATGKTKSNVYDRIWGSGLPLKRMAADPEPRSFG
jgi:hypothetical protein